MCNLLLGISHISTNYDAKMIQNGNLRPMGLSLKFETIQKRDLGQQILKKVFILKVTPLKFYIWRLRNSMKLALKFTD